MSDRLIDVTGGYGTIYKQVMKEPKLSIEAKAIYCYLSSYAGGKDIAFPSVSLICHELNISKNRFYKHRNELVDKQIISVKRERTENGFSKNIYTINHHFVCRNFVDIQNVDIRNVDIQNVDIQNEDTKNNSIKKNNIKNNKEKNNSSSSDDTTTAYDFLLNNFVEMQNTNKQKEVSNLLQDIKDNTLDVVKVATNYCKENNKGLNYFISVIRNWIDENIDSKEKAEAKVMPKKSKSQTTDDVIAAYKKELGIGEENEVNNNEDSNHDQQQPLHSTNVFDFYQSNGFGIIQPTITDQINAWVNDFNGNEDIIIEALKEAATNNVYKWAYVNSILKNWYQDGIKSVDDIEARRKQREAISNRGKSNSGSYLNKLLNSEDEAFDNSQYKDLF